MPTYDLIVIESGPAGQRAAIQAAKAGKQVALIEKREVVGGVCINVQAPAPPQVTTLQVEDVQRFSFSAFLRRFNPFVPRPRDGKLARSENVEIEPGPNPAVECPRT